MQGRNRYLVTYQNGYEVLASDLDLEAFKLWLAERNVAKGERDSHWHVEPFEPGRVPFVPARAYRP